MDAISIVAMTIALTGGLMAGPEQNANLDPEPITSQTPPPCERPTDLAADAPVLLMFHPGGFILPVEKPFESACKIAARAGFDTVFVEYPLGDLPAAAETARRVARQQQRSGNAIYAYGESAGGTLASLLAQEGLVDAAATYSQVTDLVAYYRATPDPPTYVAFISSTWGDLRRLSPSNQDASGSLSPIFTLVAELDTPALNEATVRWGREEPGITISEVPGGHLGIDEPRIYARNVETAVSWLEARSTGR